MIGLWCHWYREEMKALENTRKGGFRGEGRMEARGGGWPVGGWAGLRTKKAKEHS